jgi:hypothetical protein
LMNFASKSLPSSLSSTISIFFLGATLLNVHI